MCVHIQVRLYMHKSFRVKNIYDIYIYIISCACLYLLHSGIPANVDILMHSLFGLLPLPGIVQSNCYPGGWTIPMQFGDSKCPDYHHPKVFVG